MESTEVLMLMLPLIALATHQSSGEQNEISTLDLDSTIHTLVTHDNLSDILVGTEHQIFRLATDGEMKTTDCIRDDIHGNSDCRPLRWETRSYFLAIDRKPSFPNIVSCGVTSSFPS